MDIQKSATENKGIKKHMSRQRILHTVLIVEQTLLTAGALYYILDIGILPMGIAAAAAAMLVGLLGLCVSLQLQDKPFFRYLGTILCIPISIVLFILILYLMRIDQTLSEISKAQTQTDNMVVAVRVEDPAQYIQDTAGYRYGISATGKTGSLTEMLEDIEEQLGEELDTTEYPSPYEQAEALLEGNVDALVYNSALTGLLDEVIAGYSDKVRLIYFKEVTYEIEPEESVSPTDGPITERSFHVYISGIDTSGPISTTSRSDVNIIMTVNPRTHKILLTTTPRDFYVPIPGISGGMRDKLTHAGVYGIDASMAALEELYGIYLEFYIRINFTSLTSLVDVLGGVDVYSQYAFDAGTYHFEQGFNHLDGDAALAFSRERYAFTDGDNQRGRNQQAVLTAIIEKLQSPSVLTRADEIMAVVRESMQTSVPKEDIALMINHQISTMPRWSVESQQAGGTGDSQPTYSMGNLNLYVMWPDEELIEKLSDRMDEVFTEQE